jgi:hypothetical protein
MDKEKIYELAQKKESELTEQDIEYLNNLTKDDEDIINTLISINIYYIKYLKLKEEDINISEGIYYAVYFSELYEKIKESDELKKLSIDNKIEFIKRINEKNEKLIENIRSYEEQFEKNYKQKINNEISRLSNELINYLNEETIYWLIREGIEMSLITNNKDKIKEYIEKGYPNIIDYVNPNILQEELIEKVLKKDYIINETTPQIIKNNPKFIKYLIEHGQENIINYVDEKILEQNEELVHLAIDNGYLIDESVPNYLRQFKYIKYEVEKGRAIAIDYLDIDNIKEVEKKELDKLIFSAIDKGYLIEELSPNYIKKIKFIKYAVEKGYENAINYLDIDHLREEEKQELDKLIFLAIDKGYMISRRTHKIIKNNPEYIRNIIVKNSLYTINNIPEEILKQNLDLIKISIENGYRVTSESPEIIINNIDIIKYIINLQGTYILDYLSDNLIKNTPELHKIAYKSGYWNKLEILIKDGLVKSPLNNKELLSIKKYWEINDKIIKEEYKNYIMKNIDSIDEEKIELVGDLFCRLATTNSKALYSMRKSLAGQLLTLDNSVESFNKIEKIFIRNNIPLYAKMFFCFKTLYPNLTNRQRNILFDDTSRMSPELKDSTLVHTNIEKIMTNPTNNDIRFYIIYNDLLRNAVKSNSTDLRKYLDNIELGDYLYKKISGENITNEKFDNLSELEKKEALEIFTSHLETIYHNTKEGKQDKTDLSNYDLAEKIKYLKENFKTTNKYDLKDRIVRSFGYSAGYTSFIQIRNEMKETIKEANERGIKLAQQLENKPFEFEDGDFLRCIGNYQAFSGSIENGNFSKEFLTVFRETNDSDTTPLDIDFTLIEKKQSIYHSIEGTPTGFGFGNVFLVIKKDNPNLNITRDKDGNLTENKYNPKKLEMFGTKIEGTGGYQTHWGVRTGMSLTDVDYILFKEKQINDKKPYNEDGTINYIGEPSPYDDLSKIKFEIARHGYYIPVIDFTGKLIFSVDEYNNLKGKMNGLSYYENNEFKFSNNLEIEGIEEITPYLDKSNEITETKRNKIYDVLTPILEEHNLKLKTKIDGDLTQGSVEIIDTGSTGRKTNKIGDGDFDFLLRIDQKIFRDTQKYEQLKNNIKETIEKYPYESLVITDKGDYRFKKVQLDKDTVVDIDLSFTIKTDKITYSTDECLKDRLRTIEKQYKEKYKQVVSNIILAKQIIKKAECYKPSRSDKNQGGLGGSGIENWILQNGGSFIDASEEFIKATKEPREKALVQLKKVLETNPTMKKEEQENLLNQIEFSEFKKQYFVWDFGENHFAERKGEYPHDNFIDNMNEIGYQKMKQCLNQYLQNYNQENRIEQAKTL